MKCIYCLEDKSSSEFQNREHVIPQCFGRFKPDNLVLRDTVCDECNSYFGNKIELFWGRDSFEGVERLRHGIKPKEELRNKRRVKSKISNGPLKGALVLIKEIEGSDNISVERVAQAGFYHPEKNEYNYFELGKIPSREELEQLGYEIKDQMIYRIGDEAEFIALENELKDKGINFKSDTEFIKGPGPGEIVRVELEITLDKTILRGICKIAFNYLSHLAGSSFALSDNFNYIRRFIRYGEGRSDDFIAVNQPPILREEQLFESFGVKFTQGHLIIIGWNRFRNRIVSKVSLFNTHTYGINLCYNFSGIWIPLDSGHHFDLENNEVSKLIAINTLLTP